AAENKVFRILLDVFRHKKWAGAELPAIKPTPAELLANPKNLTYQLLTWDPDYPGYAHDDIVECLHPVPEMEALLRQAMVLHNQYRWDRSQTRLCEVARLEPDGYVGVFSRRTAGERRLIRRVR